MFDSRVIPRLDNFVDLSLSDAMVEILQNEDPEFHSGYLKPYMAICAQQGLTTDYLALRHALGRLGYGWNSLSPMPKLS